jgi:hypothetical protein
MTRLTTALLITAMAGTASAGDIYNGFARGNPDLYPESLSGSGTGYGVQASQRIGAQPGVGDVGMGSRSRGSDWVTYQQSEPFRHYHDWARGNGDLYPEGVAGTGER